MTFYYPLETSFITSTVTTLEGIFTTQNQETKNKNLVGIARVNKNFDQSTYTIYNPYNNQLNLGTLAISSLKLTNQRLLSP